MLLRVRRASGEPTIAIDRDVVGWAHAGSRRKPMHIVVMGVSATGKTTVGEGLAEELGCEFIEGDSLHPQRNIEKMAHGHPAHRRGPLALAAGDRASWSRVRDPRVRRRSSPARRCKRAYRDVLRAARRRCSSCTWTRRSRCCRSGWPSAPSTSCRPSLLHSQFDTLEPLDDDEAGAVVDVTPPFDEVVEEAVNAVRVHYTE